MSSTESDIKARLKETCLQGQGQKGQSGGVAGGAPVYIQPPVYNLNAGHAPQLSLPTQITTTSAAPTPPTATTMQWQPLQLPNAPLFSARNPAFANNKSGAGFGIGGIGQPWRVKPTPSPRQPLTLNNSSGIPMVSPPAQYHASHLQHLGSASATPPYPGAGVYGMGSASATPPYPGAGTGVYGSGGSAGAGAGLPSVSPPALVQWNTPYERAPVGSTTSARAADAPHLV